MTSCRHSRLSAFFLLSTQLFTRVASLGGSPHSSTHSLLTPSGTDGKVGADAHVQALMRTEPDTSHVKHAAPVKGHLKHAKHAHSGERREEKKHTTHSIQTLESGALHLVAGAKSSSKHHAGVATSSASKHHAGVATPQRKVDKSAPKPQGKQSVHQREHGRHEDASEREHGRHEEDASEREYGLETLPKRLGGTGKIPDMSEKMFSEEKQPNSENHAKPAPKQGKVWVSTDA